MMLSISVVAVAITLTLFQFLRQSSLGWKVAKWLSLLLFVLSFWNASEQDKDREFYIRSLEQIGTRVNWRDTDVSVELLNEAQTISTQGISVQIKLLSPAHLRLPPNSAIDLAAVQRSCVLDPHWGLGYMPSLEAQKLFHAFAQPDGSIALDTEKEAGIEHLLYSGKETLATPLGARVRMHLDLGPNTQSQFSSLSDFNDTIGIALIQAGPTKTPIVSSLSVELETAAGPQPIHIPVRLIEPGNPRLLTGSRYVGFCVPKGHFGVVRRRG